MMKCTNCGNQLTDKDVLVWRCKKCGKLFKIDIGRLNKI